MLTLLYKRCCNTDHSVINIYVNAMICIVKLGIDMYKLDEGVVGDGMGLF